jgi:dephospho-CoA kinase
VRVGLTGGIGSGKSLVSAFLAAFGAVIIDYDLLAREAVAPGSAALAAILDRFGQDLLQPDGHLNRPALGEIVFDDVAARRDLEAITHPAIGALAWTADESAPPGSIVVHDHPLLVESGMAELCDVVVVVDVPVDLQIERLVALRGMTASAARARVAAQASREDRRAAADIVIDNSGTLDDLRVEVERVWDQLKALGGQVGVSDPT